MVNDSGKYALHPIELGFFKSYSAVVFPVRSNSISNSFCLSSFLDIFFMNVKNYTLTVQAMTMS